MKRPTTVALAFAIALTVAGAAPLASQMSAPKPARLGIMGGVTFPRGSDFTDVAKRGWNGGVLIALGAPAFPLSFRLEGQWHQLAGKTRAFPDEGSQRTDLRIIDGTADFEWTFGKPAASNFYLIGGVGLYKLRGRNFTTPGNISGGTDSTFTETATKFGWNGGAGFRFQLTGYTLFVESRYHSVSHGHVVDGSASAKAMTFVPIDIGITL
ncbi:MAG: outer membrane beta-barrel protein [Gemmatimonadaceae bacterium]|nr:outer membrane beta-barrel protein [Gemmatimonadaceae bacterium]